MATLLFPAVILAGLIPGLINSNWDSSVCFIGVKERVGKLYQSADLSFEGTQVP